jgi:hypothetical protein
MRVKPLKSGRRTDLKSPSKFILFHVNAASQTLNAGYHLCLLTQRGSGRMPGHAAGVSRL